MTQLLSPTENPSLCPLQSSDDETQRLSEHLVAQALKDMPAKPDERLLQGRIFDTRQRLVQSLMQECAAQNTESGSGALNTPAMSDILEKEDIWRDALPPLMLPPIRQVAHFSAWRTAFLALLGLILGLALGQALTQGFSSVAAFTAEAQTGAALTSMSSSAELHTGLQFFCGLAGAMTLVWLAEYLVAAMTLGRIKIGGKVHTWKRFRRLCTWGFVGLLVLSLVRDFLGAKVGLLHFVQAVGLMLTSGQVMPVFTNIYGILLCVFLFSMLLKRPLSFDSHDFAEKLHMAIAQWWAGARLVGPLLQENMRLKNDPTKDAWKKVGMELYSLAGELPEARGQWLEERLRRLGIEVTREQGVLQWSEDMAERYTPLGHIAVGDACYVDEPPLMEQGLLARKGTVRKVRV